MISLIVSFPFLIFAQNIFILGKARCILEILMEKNVVGLQRRRRIEAINGAWAMLGLTAGLVIEGHTGNSILAQVSCVFWRVNSDYRTPLE